MLIHEYDLVVVGAGGAGLDHPAGIWACVNFFECTRICPRLVKATALINRAKRRAGGRRNRAESLPPDRPAEMSRSD